METSVQ